MAAATLVANGAAEMQINRAVDVFAGKGDAAGDALVKRRQPVARHRDRFHGKHRVKHVHQVAVHEFADVGDLNGLAHKLFGLQRRLRWFAARVRGARE